MKQNKHSKTNSTYISYVGGGLRPQFINNTKLLKKGESIFFNIIYLFSIVFNRDNETIVGGGVSQ